jgi:opacity protein-like surface antigen
VEILEEKIKRPPGFYEEPAEEFHGLGFTLKLAAGLSLFSGGDFYRGAAGMFDSSADAFLSSGYSQMSRRPKSFRSGFEVGGDIVYDFSPHFGVGLGMDYVYVQAESLFVFQGNDAIALKLRSTPWIHAFSIKLGLFYNLPVSSWLTVCLNGGPALFLVKYDYNRNVVLPGIVDDFYQQVRAEKIGFRGGLGLEIQLNPRMALLLEAQGRYARISNFEGSEKFSHEVGGWPNIREDKGFLYYVGGAKYAELAVLSEEAANSQNASKAVLDFTGISLLAGLRFRF